MARALKFVRPLVLLALLATSVSVAQPATATFPGANGKIAFTRYQNGADVYVVNPDGSAATRLTDDSAVDSEPAWSPDGTKIAFNSQRDGGDFEIVVMDADGANEVQITSNTAEDFHPEFTFDGRIVFARDPDGVSIDDSELWIMNADGTGQIQLTDNSSIDMLPAPAPGEDRVAWTSDRDGDQDIYVMHLDGSGVTQVTNHPAIDALPSWAPRGNRLAFISERDYPLSLPEQAPPDDGELYTVKANGTDLRRVTYTPDRSEIVPAWSPAGDRIAFTGCDIIFVPLDCAVHLINPDGTGELRIADHGAQPDWQRLAPGEVSKVGIG